MIQTLADYNDIENAQSRRRHERTLTRGSVKACVKGSADPAMLDQEFELEIIEISPGGLRLRAPEVIEADAFDLLASIDGFPTAIFLCTSVRWEELGEDDSQLIGVEIEDHEASDLDTWCDFQREEWFRDQPKAE